MVVPISHIIGFYVVIVGMCLSPFISLYFITRDKGGNWEGKK